MAKQCATELLKVTFEVTQICGSIWAVYQHSEQQPVELTKIAAVAYADSARN